jgi:sugar phosphate isomerase/epimerase
MTAEIFLGVNNGFAAKVWPEPEAWARIIAKELGIKQVQFSFDLFDPTISESACTTECSKILKAVETERLDLHSTFTGLIIYSQNHLAHPSPDMRAAAYRWYQKAIDFSAKLGAQACGGYIGAMSAVDFADPSRRQFLRSVLIDYVHNLACSAAALGLKYFLWEPMPTPREIPHNPEEAVAILEAVNSASPIPVYLCFDLGHCNSFDFDMPGDPHFWFERLLPWIRIVHLQQTDGIADHHWPFTPEYNKVGIIDAKRIIEIAKDSPFHDLPMFFELSHPFDCPDERIVDDHKRSIDLWAKYL